jgi:hypothetical protein
MSQKPDAVTPAKSSARSMLAIVVLVAIVAFVGYGFFERSRLLTAQELEKKSIAIVKEIKGVTMESDLKDWRQLFVPDQPEMAVRVGTVTVPIMGEGPDYTQKVVGLLQPLDLCEQLYLADVPVERDPNSGGKAMGKPKPKVEVKKDDGPKGPIELLDVAVIRKEFPNLKVIGEETAAKNAEEKMKAKADAAARQKERDAQKESAADPQAAPAENNEAKADDKAAEAPADKPAEKPAEPAEKKDP